MFLLDLRFVSINFMFTNNLCHVKINLIIFFNLIECMSRKTVNIKLKHVT